MRLSKRNCKMYRIRPLVTAIFVGPNSFGRGAMCDRRVRMNSHLRHPTQPAAQSRAEYVFRQPGEHERDTDQLQRRQAFA